MDWFALLVWSGRETAVAAALGEAGIAAYVPEGRQVVARRHCRAAVVVLSPVMPGYVFVAGLDGVGAALWREDGRRMALGVVARRSDERPIAIPEGEILRLRALQAAGGFDVLPLAPGRRRTTVRIGDRVTVHGGPLAGAEGVVEGLLRRGGRDVVVIPLGAIRAQVEADAVVAVGLDRAGRAA